MKTNLNYLVKLNSTAQDVVDTIQLQPMLLSISDKAALLYQHAHHICTHHNPFAVLKSISDDGKTVWEDGVDSTVELKMEVEDATR